MNSKLTVENKVPDIDFVAVGPQRTGTTWLYETLQHHPELYLPDAVKETMFFDRRYDRGIGWYGRYFDDSQDGELCGEIAPTYFDDSTVPSRISDLAPDCEIFINLRHPAERAFSLYLHHLRKGRVDRDFCQAVEQKPRIITAGHYATHVPRWQSAFGEEQVHFLFLDDIKKQPQEVLDQICMCLGIGHMEPPDRANEKVNEASMPRFPWLARGAALLTTAFHKYGLHKAVAFGKKLGLKKLAYTGGEDDMPELSANDREQLIQTYNEDVVYVEELTGRDLFHWRE